MATFCAPAEAVIAAVANQRSIPRRNWAVKGYLYVRKGISAGEVGVTDDDVLGYAVKEATRRCAAADCDAATGAEESLVRGRGDHGYSLERGASMAR